jgi:hypothetical protein
LGPVGDGTGDGGGVSLAQHLLIALHVDEVDGDHLAIVHVVQALHVPSTRKGCLQPTKNNGTTQATKLHQGVET